MLRIPFFSRAVRLPGFLFIVTAAVVAAAPSVRATNSDLYVAPGPIDAVNLLSRPYAYQEKAGFVSAVEDRIAFLEAAMANWKATPESSSPEAKEYAKRGQETIAPLLEAARSSLNSAKSAGSSSWANAHAESRRALLAALRAYHELHGNR